MAQINLTDGDFRIIPSKDGMVQAFNAQATVDCTSRLLVETHMSQRPTDVNLLAQTVDGLSRLNTKIGTVSELLADAGY